MSIFRKNWLLLMGSITIVILSYFLAFDPTLKLKSELKLLQAQKEIQEKTRKELIHLEKQNRYYSKLLEKHKIATDVSLQNKLLEHLNRLTHQNKLIVVSFNPTHAYTAAGTTFETYSFKVRGSYTSIVKLIYDLEQLTKFGKVTSVMFDKIKNHKTQRSYLDCELYIQRIRQ